MSDVIVVQKSSSREGKFTVCVGDCSELVVCGCTRIYCVLEKKCTKSAVNNVLSLLLFLTSQRKLYVVVICSTV